jgi:hypothetical protein
MARVLRLFLPLGLVGIVSAWLVSTVQATGDWSVDAWPAVDALAHGRVSGYLAAKAMMGPFSTLVQAPFAAIPSGGELDAYRWAAFPCVFAAGLLGLYLAGIARRRGASSLAQIVLAGLCLVNPLTVEALRAGHPEEILTAALAVAAIASASEGKRGRAAVLLGLAVASKQWAVIAILPTLMALSGSRLRVALSAGAVVVALVLPGLIASPANFFEVTGNAADTGRVVTPWSVWYPVATVRTEMHRVDETKLVAHVHEAPPLAGSLSHPLVVLLAVALPLALALRRRSFGLTGADAMALLALLALLRSALDPVDNLYYHEPLLLALLGWDALAAPRSLPLRGLAGAAIALVFWDWSNNLVDVTLFNAVYVGLAVVVGLAIWAALFRSGRQVYGLSAARPRNCPRPEFSADEIQISGIQVSPRAAD